MPTLRDKFKGCLLGSAIGDIAGAPVEAESAAYIAKTYRSIDQILTTKNIPEFTGPDWQPGHFTDDTQMTLSVAQWLIDDSSHSPQNLLARLASESEPWRRYGPGTLSILRLFPEHKSKWRELSTSMFPHGSHGNGSATRAAPIALAFFKDLKKAVSLAIESSRPTHSHTLALQGAVLQTIAVATAVSSTEIEPAEYLNPLRTALIYFTDLLHDTSPFTRALDAIEQGLARRASCSEMSEILGTGITAHEAVPMALYCFLRHPHSYADVIHQAVFIGGDTDTIASMAGAISGAFLGLHSIRKSWIEAIREETYTPAAIEKLADQLFAKYAPPDIGSTQITL